MVSVSVLKALLLDHVGSCFFGGNYSIGSCCSEKGILVAAVGVGKSTTRWTFVAGWSTSRSRLVADLIQQCQEMFHLLIIQEALHLESNFIWESVHL